MAHADNKADPNKFHFERKNYFVRFVPNQEEPTSRHLRHALEYFVDDLRRDRDRTIERLLNEPNVNDIFRSIGQLLTNPDDR